MVKIEYDQNNHIFPTHIETERLIFERITYDNISVKEFFNIYKNIPSDTTEYVLFTPYDSHIEAKEFIDKCIEDFENGDSASYFIKKKDGQKHPFIGISDFNPEWDRSVAQSGIYLLEEYWGYGYSTERGEMMLYLAFEEYNMKHWISKCHPDNKGSLGAIGNYVVDNGGRRIGTIPNDEELVDEYRDTVYFTISRDAYMSNK